MPGWGCSWCARPIGGLGRRDLLDDQQVRQAKTRRGVRPARRAARGARPSLDSAPQCCRSRRKIRCESRSAPEAIEQAAHPPGRIGAHVRRSLSRRRSQVVDLRRVPVIRPAPVVPCCSTDTRLGQNRTIRPPGRAPDHLRRRRDRRDMSITSDKPCEPSARYGSAAAATGACGVSALAATRRSGRTPDVRRILCRIGCCMRPHRSPPGITASQPGPTRDHPGGDPPDRHT